MTARARFRLTGVGALLLALIPMVMPPAASAKVIWLCDGYADCADAGMNASGYAKNNGTSYWRMFTGHNCTNYVAYRMVKSGLPNSRPWSGEGNAENWGKAMRSITNDTPRVGAVAWWDANVSPAGSSGHVAYVEQVVSADEIIVSQDSWGGDFSWARVTRSGSGWPSGFVHFNDVPMRNTAPPVISGTAKVGDTLATSAGTWKPSDVTATYQWRADGERIPGATASTLSLDETLLDKAITVRVSASKLGYPTTRVLSAATPEVLPGVISNTAAPTVRGHHRVDGVLTATAGSWYPTPDRISYQWLADGTPIAGADSTTLALKPSLVGASVALRVTASRTAYDDVVVTTPARRIQPGTLTLTRTPSLRGTAALGQTLTLVGARATPRATVEVQWLRDGRAVPGATGSSYTVSKHDLGSRISVRSTVTRAGYTTLTPTTERTARIRTQPRLRLEITPHRHRVQITAHATARGLDPVTGTVRFVLGKQVLTVDLHEGKATARFNDLRSGERSLRVVLPRSRSTERVAVTRVVTIG